MTLGCVCGADLWYDRGQSPHALGPIGHECIGIVDQFGSEVSVIRTGDLVIAPAMDERRAVKALLRIGSAS